LSGIQPILGIVFIVLGSIHFLNRDRAPAGRSIFVGSMATSARARLGFACVETLIGVLLLVTS
jgi:hypothetical protein